jgi:hypothetical protein
MEEECKTGLDSGKVLMGRAGDVERVKEEEYGLHTLYSCI